MPNRHILKQYNSILSISCPRTKRGYHPNPMKIFNKKHWRAMVNLNMNLVVVMISMVFSFKLIRWMLWKLRRKLIFGFVILMSILFLALQRGLVFRSMYFIVLVFFWILIIFGFGVIDSSSLANAFLEI